MTSTGPAGPTTVGPPLEDLDGYALLAHRHTVVLNDRWGTGLSDRDRSDFSLEGEVQVLVDLADHLRFRRFAVLGPSHGALATPGCEARASRRSPR